MTVSNIVSPLMVTADRFLLASIASAAAVAYYTVPFEVASKILILPLSLAAPLFASFAATREPSDQGTLLARGMVLTCLAAFPATLVLILAAPEGMTAWMGSEFAARAAPVLQLLGVGVFFNSVAQAPFAMLQATGRAELTAKVHLLELPLYLATVIVLVRRFGVEGAALAWLLRAAVDSVVLTLAAIRITPGVRGRAVAVWILALAGAVIVGARLVPIAMPDARLVYGALSGVASAGLALLALRERRKSAVAR